MIWNIVTVAVCLGAILLFRRMDRANIRIAKLKRFTEKSMKDFSQLAHEENRKYNDSTIEMDLLIKKANTISSNIKVSVDDLEKKLKGLELEKSTLKKVEEDLQVVSFAAKDVNQQIKYIEAARNGFTELTKKLATVSESVYRLEKDNSALFAAFDEKLRERSRELGEDIDQQVNELKQSISTREDMIIDASRQKINVLMDNFSDSLLQMENSITQSGDAILDNVKLKLDNIEKNVSVLENRVSTSERRVFTDLSDKVSNLESALAHFEHELNETRSEALSDTRHEISAVNEKVSDLR
jgi:hypothetical protein